MRIAIAIADALDAAHRHGLAHRDLKSEITREDFNDDHKGAGDVGAGRP